MENYLIGVKMKINDLNTNSRVSAILHLSHKTWILENLRIIRKNNADNEKDQISLNKEMRDG